jgi:hypothetical protein
MFGSVVDLYGDVDAIDALLAAGADIEAPGAVLGGGSPLADAVGFGQWNAARRLVEAGATTRLQDAAALGLMDRLDAQLGADAPPAREAITHALWAGSNGTRAPSPPAKCHPGLTTHKLSS